MAHLILGIIQGLTEFLPVSSSGHLVVLENMLHVKTEGLGLEVLLHFATLVALLIFFRRDLRFYFTTSENPFGKTPFIVLVIVGSIPAAFVGFFFQDTVEKFFKSINYVPYFFILNGIIVFSTKFAIRKRDRLTILDSLLIGIAQAFALLPGISRSGATISLALFLGVDEDKAFRFSFLLVVPAILGALLLEVVDAGFRIGISEVIGFLSALVSGLVALYILRRMMVLKLFHFFGVYTFLLGLLILLT